MHRFILSIVVLAMMPAWALSAETTLRPDDPNLPDDYVTVSILASEPGGALYSRLGHIAIRMQCPYHNLDYVFSYESEDASKKVLRFLSGRLKMGLVAISPQDYLEPFAEDGRGVTEYRVNMPLSARQNLWRILDEHLMEGMELPYDYMQRGCAYSSFRFLKESLDTIPIVYGPFPEYFRLTRREITERQFQPYKWTMAFMYIVSNQPIDEPCTNEEKLIMPADFVEVLSHATVCGQPFLDAPVQVLEPINSPKTAKFTPLHLSVGLLLLTIASALFGRNEMQYVLLVLQSLIGALSTYLVFFSSLCCTEWSWLLIPFNLLPLIFWKWRRYWQLPFGIVCLVWAMTMIFLPHKITDWSYVILAISLSVSYLLTNNIKVKKTVASL